MEVDTWDEADFVHGHFEGSITAGEAEISFESDAFGQEAALRLAGCLLVSLMPREGVEEALLELREIYRFHDENLRLTPPESEEDRTGRAVVSASSERADLVIEG